MTGADGAELYGRMVLAIFFDSTHSRGKNI